MIDSFPALKKKKKKNKHWKDKVLLVIEALKKKKTANRKQLRQPMRLGTFKGEAQIWRNEKKKNQH